MSDGLAERELRAARNESLFRELNESLEQVREGTGEGAVTDYFCECARRDCAGAVRLSAEEYEHVRSHGDTFLVLPGHVTARVERVLEQHSDHWIVEKIGIGSHVADLLDPRTN